VDVNTQIGRSILQQLFNKKVGITNTTKIGMKEIDYANANYTNAERDFLLFYCAGEMRKKNIPEFKKNAKNIYEMFLNPEIKNIFYQKEAIDTLSENYLLNNNLAKISLKEVLKNNTGKFIFIDFWASWCKPCREEMIEEKKLISLYKDKNIVFVLFSIDSDIDDWKKASRQENFNTYSENYLFPNFNSSVLNKQLNLTSIPRYVLLNKKGEIINSDALRPSDPKLKELIDKHLKD
jgi:thiol-disulfide isomerase/thioredoxin